MKHIFIFDAYETGLQTQVLIYMPDPDLLPHHTLKDRELS